MKSAEPRKTLAHTVHLMARANDDATLRALLTEKSALPLEETDRFGWTALAHAAQYDRPVMVRALLEAGADPNTAHPNWGRTALHAARSEEVARLLLDAGADTEVVTVANSFGIEGAQTPLMRAASQGRSEVVRVLIEAGADRDKRDARGRSALMYALIQEHSAIVEMLQDAGAAITLREAVLMEDTERVAALITSETSPAEKNEALWWAASREGTDVVHLLIAAGANVNASHALFEGSTPLFNAALWGRLDPVTVLLENGANVHTRVNRMTALHASLQGSGNATRIANANITHALLKAGADVNATKQYGWTPLMQAVLLRDPVFVLLILDYKADTERVSDLEQEDGCAGGFTALQLAVLHGGAETVRLLLHAGANPNNPGHWNGVTEGAPLALAQLREWRVPERMAAIIKMLIAAGAKR